LSCVCYGLTVGKGAVSVAFVRLSVSLSVRLVHSK